MRYKGILFDLDGTLLDTSELIIKSFQHTVNRHYNKAADVGVVKEYFGRPLRAALEQLGPDKVEEMLQTYREYNLIHHDRLAKAFPGVAQAVGELFAAGMLLGIVTFQNLRNRAARAQAFRYGQVFSGYYRPGNSAAAINLIPSL